MKPRRRHAPCLPCLAAVLTLGLGPALAGDTRLGLEAGVGRDSNVNRAAADARGDTFADLEGHASRSLQTGARSGALLRAGVRGREYFSYHDISSLGIWARAAWRFQPDSSYTGAWLEAAVQAEALRFLDSPIRDGSILSASVSAGKWFSDRLRGLAGAGYDRRLALEGRVYDLSSPRAWVSLDWRAGDAITLYGTGTLLGGQQVFTALVPASAGPGHAFGGSYSAWAPDPAFDAGTERFNAYRADARTTVLEAGVNWAFASQHALDAGITRYSAKADSGPTYDGYVLRAGWLYRFR